jgi:hypothetical protein
LIGRPRECVVFHRRFGIWARLPRLRRRGRRSLASSPLSAASTLNRWRGRPRFPVRTCRVSSRGRTWARSSPWAGVVRTDHGLPAASVRLGMRRPWPVRPYASPSPPPWPGGKGALHRAVLPRNHPAGLGQPKEARWHGGRRAIGLPALQPPMRGTLGRPSGSAREVTPAAAGDPDLEPRMPHLQKGGMGQAPTPLRRLRRQQRGNELPRQVASPVECSGHRALQENLGHYRMGNLLVG